MSRRSIQLVTALASTVLGLPACNAKHADAPASSDGLELDEPQLLLSDKTITQFVQPLPVLAAAGGTIATAGGNTSLTIRMCELDAKMLPAGTIASGVETTTRVFGYILGDACPTEPQDTYIGPVLINERGSPTTIRYVNQLGSGETTGVLAWKYAVDQTLHWADPLGDEANECSHMGMPPEPGSECARTYRGPIPAVPHLHGGEVPPEVDGAPNAWFTGDGAYHGRGYYSAAGAAENEAILKYPNVQEAAPIWFHDHSLGITRVNVYAGLAGAYLLTDSALALPAGLSAIGLSRNGIVGADEITIPIVIQDRTFDTNGQLVLPAGVAGGAPNPEHPYWVPEFTGETIVVNGKAWPYLDVEPKRYRFWLVNGSNARTYELFLADMATDAYGPPLYVIAGDGGYLDAPEQITPPSKLLMMPGERYELIVDFSAIAPGTELLLRNTARTPYPFGDAVQGSALGRILQIRVGPCTSGECGADDSSYDPASGQALRSGEQKIVRLVDPATGSALVAPDKTRQLTLNEVMGTGAMTSDPNTGEQSEYPGGPLEVLLNNTKFTGESPRQSMYGDFAQVDLNGTTSYLSELPEEGQTELWEIVNLTADAHPIHLHLVQFQILDRQAFASRYARAYAAAFPPVPGSDTCPGGVFCPGFGPPRDYRTGNARALGGNPDITRYLLGPRRPPEAYESGWKDTVIAPPGQVTRIVVRWAPTDQPAAALPADLYYPFDPSAAGKRGYVWHCHIIDHEDNEMMRPDLVQPNPLSPSIRSLQPGIDY